MHHHCSSADVMFNVASIYGPSPRHAESREIAIVLQTKATHWHANCTTPACPGRTLRGSLEQTARDFRRAGGTACISAGLSCALWQCTCQIITGRSGGPRSGAVAFLPLKHGGASADCGAVPHCVPLAAAAPRLAAMVHILAAACPALCRALRGCGGCFWRSAGSAGWRGNPDIWPACCDARCSSARSWSRVVEFG